MARIFWDGFDTYSTLAQLDSVYPFRGGFGFVAGGRFGGRCIATQSGSATNWLGKQIASTPTLTAGVAIKPNGTDRSSNYGLVFSRSGAITAAEIQIGWTLTPLGAIKVYTGNLTTLWQSADGIVPDAAQTYVGFSALISDTVGKFALSINGVQLVEVTGIDTQGVAADSAITYCVMGQWGANFKHQLYYDDFYLDDAYMATPLERRVETLYVSADGAHLDLTPSTGATHFGVVDEATVNEADYLSGSTVGQYDELGLTDLGNVPTAIDGVKAVGYGLKTDAATRAWNYGIRSNGVDELGSNHVLGGTTLQGWDNHLLNPDGAVAWDAAAVNAMKMIPTVAV